MSSTTHAAANTPLHIGVSACLLGEHVRYDGKDKHHPWICKTLQRDFKLISVCPEVAIGMSVPRAPIQLVEMAGTIKALGIADHTKDFTKPLLHMGISTAKQLRHIRGFIFKSRSPSCGFGSTPVHRTQQPPRKGSGLFAQGLTTTNPLLPIIEETELEHPDRRSHFLEQVQAYHDWQCLLDGGTTKTKLHTFHAQHKLQLLAHGQNHLQKMDRLLQEPLAIHTLAKQYGYAFMHTLRYRITPTKQARVLKLLGKSLQPSLNVTQRMHLQHHMEHYLSHTISLQQALTPIRQHFNNYKIEDSAARHYFTTMQPYMN